jgi:hypothetical protein
MIGKIHLVWLGLVGLSSGILFHTSYEVQSLEERLGSLNREIIHEQEAIQILKAEWSHLNEPGRIEHFARKYTLLAPTAAVQLAASAEAVPPRAPEALGPALVSAPVPRSKPSPGMALPGAGPQSVASAAAPTSPAAPAAAPLGTPHAGQAHGRTAAAIPASLAAPYAAARGQVADLPLQPLRIEPEPEPDPAEAAAPLSIPGVMFTNLGDADE